MLLRIGNKLLNTEKVAFVEYKPAAREGDNASASVFCEGSTQHHFYVGKEAEILWREITADITDLAED